MAKQKDTDGTKQLKLEEVDITADLDPHLQEMVLQARSDNIADPSVACRNDQGDIIVDVIAKLKDPSGDVDRLNIVHRIGAIVTGSVRAQDIETVRSNENVISLKSATRTHPSLRFSVPEIGVSVEQLRIGLPDLVASVDGKGIIVGVVDFGCDFQHRNFRKADGSTRLLALWDQSGGRSAISPIGFGYGHEFSADDINQALETPDPYFSLRYDPGSQSHGTHVLDIAAGNGHATGQAGVAPNADLIFVQLAASDFGDEENFGNSRRLLEAVAYIFEKAAALGKPAVVNLSLGTNGGPHDGTTLVEQAFDEMLTVPGRAIVIAAGNSWEHGSHASGTVAAGSDRTLTWKIQQADQTGNEIEVWYPGADSLSATLIAPDNTRLGPVALGRTVNITLDGVRIGRIIHRQNDPNNGDNHLDILLHAGLAAGDWKVEMHNPGNRPVPFHAWIERDDFGRSQFGPTDDDRAFTIGSISCGRRTIVVGSFDATVPNRSLSFFTSEGPTRDGRQKPEISAPGHGIIAASSRSQSTTRKSGTSMAAPHITGLVALMFQVGGHELTSEDITFALQSTARPIPDHSLAWHSRYGTGRVDGLACLRHFAPANAVAASASPRVEVTASVTGGNGSDGELIGKGFVMALTEIARQSRSRIRLDIGLTIEPITNGALNGSAGDMHRQTEPIAAGQHGEFGMSS